MFPEEFIKRIQDQSYIDAYSLLKSLEEPPATSIRINHNKWHDSPVNSENVPWCQNGYYLPSRPSFTTDPLFHSGCYYPQESSGMFLEQVIKQTSASLDNIRVLDLCGAPGGKSIHLSDLIGSGSLLIANETIGSRSEILAETVTRWGSINTLVTSNDPSHFGRLPGFFDTILVDAPCSGEGMFRNKVAVSEWSVENTVLCSARQKRIITDIWPALRENGVLIYSTCTFNNAENENNVQWLIKTKAAESIRLEIADFKGIKEIEHQGIFGYGFYPDKVRGEGFFISALRKTGQQERVNARTRVKAEYKPDKKDLAVSEKWTLANNEKIFKLKDEVFALPCPSDEYIFLFQKLKIVKAGTKLFVNKKNDVLPTYELSLSQYLRKGIFSESEIDLSSAISYLRRDNFVLNNIPEGWNIVTYKGVRLGFIKNIGNRINNYFPVEWRIRMDVGEREKESLIKWENS